MKRENLGYWFLIFFFCVVGFISWKVYFTVYRKADTLSIHHFPKNIEGWTSEELTVSDDDKEILETDNVFVRRYTNAKDEEVFLFIVYSQNNRKVSHPPEICYSGAGATILNSVHDSLTSESGDFKIDMNRLTIEKGDVRQIFVYWFKVGDIYTSNYWKQQALIALRSVLGRPASSALIRISSTVYHGDDNQSIKLIKDFGQAILPYLPQYLP